MIEEKIISIENKLKFTLTKGKLEDHKYNFKLNQKIANSEIVTFDSTPPLLKIIEEDSSADFSLFGHKWTSIQNLNVTSIDTSQDGKFSIATLNTGGLSLSLDFGNTWITLNDDTVTTSIVYSSVCISLDGSVLIAISESQTVISKDFGNTWSIIDISYVNSSLSISSDNKIIIVSGKISKDYGQTWNLISIDSIVASSTCQFLSSYDESSQSPISYSNDFGNSFKVSDSPQNNWISLAISATGQYQTAITSNYLIWRSTNYGKNWTQTGSPEATLVNVTISSSGKYQLISGDCVYVSKDFGESWRTYFSNSPHLINYISLSYNGRIGIMCSNSYIFVSSISVEYIKESGSGSFSPLDDSTFASEFLIQNFPELTGNCKIVSSRYGKYKSISVNNGYIWRSDDYGVTYNTTASIKNWSSIAMSRSGKYQTAIITEGEVWRSDDYGLNFYKIDSQIIGGFNLNDIAMSENGKYQTTCGDGGNVLSSTDGGYNWIASTICGGNLISICMSKNGRYQSVCGVNNDDNTNMYSKTYGSIWKYSNLSNSIISWKSISCSSCGQYQTMCSFTNDIMISEDFGVNWFSSLSGVKDWCLVFITYDSRIQLACEYGGNIYISRNFGYTWDYCYSTFQNWKSLTVTDTLQYIDVIYENNILTSKIDGDVPGIITINTISTINNNATILLSGNNSNLYSYETNHSDSFNIISSDIQDAGTVSYCIMDYGQSFD